MPDKTDEGRNEILLEEQQESDEHLGTKEAEASQIAGQKPRRSQRMSNLSGWYEPPVALLPAATAELNSLN